MVPALVAFVALVFPVNAQAQCQVDKVTAPPPVPANANDGDRYGWSVAVNGNYAVVGADRGDGGGTTPQASTGAAFLLRRDGLNWVQIQHLVANDSAASVGDDFGSSVAISEQAELIVVGALSAKGAASVVDAGAVYVFKRHQDSLPCTDNQDCIDAGLTTCANEVCEGSTWAIETKLLANDPASGVGFGFSVDMSANVVVVGANRTTEGSDTNSGAAYVFRRYEDNFPCTTDKDCQLVGLNAPGACVAEKGICAGVTWQFEQKLTASNPISNAFFGASVSVEGNRIVVGAFGATDTTGSNVGIAYIFEYDGATWNEEQKLAASDGQGADGFGQAVELFGDTVVVTAMSADPGGVSAAGKAYVYRHAGDSFGDERILTASNGFTSDRFGRSASLNGNNLLIGARDTDDPGSRAGSAYLFNFDGTDWNEIEIILASDATGNDRFGHSVSLSETYGIVGAYRVDDAGSDAGAAYLFAIGLGRDCNDNLIPDDCDILAGTEPDLNNNGTPDPCECQSDNDCTGGDECSITICNQDSLCEVIINTGFCRIAGVCYADGEPDPHNSCQVCDASVDQNEFKQPSGSCADDGSDCTNDICILGICEHLPALVGTACGDQQTNTDCNKPDTCNAAGECLQNLESDDTPCVLNPPDENDCTDDLCEAGVCVTIAVAGRRCGNDADTDCDKPDTCDIAGVCQTNIQPDGTTCDDRLFCNGEDRCTSGLCDAHSNVPCTGVAETCLEGSDECVCDPVVEGACDDQDICTADACVGHQCSHTLIPECCVVVEDCHDDNECTQDSCIQSRCRHSSLPADSPCGDSSDSLCDHPDGCDGAGLCKTNIEPDGTSCDDQLFCNGNEVCEFGECQSSDVPCGGNLPPMCDEQFDVCFACPSDEFCDDGLFCTGAEECLEGACSSPGNPCSELSLPVCDEQLDGCFPCQENADCGDGNACTIDRCDQPFCVHPRAPKGASCGNASSSSCDQPDFCDGLGNCQENLAPDGTLCQDAFFCNGKESCVAGVCLAASDPCAGSDFPVCDEASDACMACAADEDCDDGLECTDDVCALGQCIFPWVARNTPCGDQRKGPCKRPDFCDGFGLCVDNAKPDGTSCEDGLYCTGEDTCLDGVCTHTGNDCVDGGLFCDEQTDSCSETRPTKVIYSNTFGTRLWRPQPTSIWIADDIATTAVDACKIIEVTIRVNGGIPGGGGQFGVRTWLWTGCPKLHDENDPLSPQIIAGTELLFEGLDDNDAIDHDLQLIPPGEVISLPPTFWIQVSFTTPRSGWVIGTPATTGLSADAYNHPFIGCHTYFGGWPIFPHASGYVVVRAEETCATMFPTYRAISPNADPFLPPLGSENRVADDIELVGGTCELAAYEVAIRGTAGPYEMSMDLRLTPDGIPIPGTEFFFEGRGDGSREVARFAASPETVIEIPPEVWMTWQASNPVTGVLNVGRTQIGKSKPTFAVAELDHWAPPQWDLDQTLPDKEAAFHISIFCRGTERTGTCCPAQTPGTEPTCDHDNPIPASECAFTEDRCGILLDCPSGRWVEHGQCFPGGGTTGSFHPLCGLHACCGFGTCTDRSYEDCMATTDRNAIDRPCETHLDCPADRLCQTNGICEPEHAVWHTGEFCGAQSFHCPSLVCAFSEGDCFSKADELPCVTDADCPSFRRCLTELDVPVCEARTSCGNGACCDEVCSSGPVGAFCCEIGWDSVCAAFADETCSQGRGDACFDETDPSRSAILLASANHSFEVNNRNANVMEDEPGFACHGTAPGKKGRGSVWYRFRATETSARIHTCDTPGTARLTDSLLQVMNSHLGVCADGTACNIGLRNCNDEAICRFDEQSACTSLRTVGCNDDTSGCGENGLNSDLCVTGLVPGEWYYVLLASKTDAHLGLQRLAIEIPCPGLTPAVRCERIVSSVPANCAIDARQPHAIDNDISQSLQDITVTFAPKECDAHTLNEFGVHVESTPAGSPRFAFLKGAEGNQATVELDRPLAPRQWICISHISTEGQICIGALPGDVNGDGTSNPAVDLSALIDCINRPGVCPAWQEDIDRSGGDADVLDITRLIDLFNGAATYQSFTGASLGGEACPSE